MPRFSRIESASLLIGPLAASAITRALIELAFSIEKS
jgi:hypothetical protein